MSEDDARELRDSIIRHHERISVLEKAIEKQEPKLDSIISTLGKLSSYNVEVAAGLRKAVFGNGSPGLVKEMEQIKERTESRKDTHDKDITRVERVLCYGGTTLILTLLTIIGYLFVAHFGK